MQHFNHRPHRLPYLIMHSVYVFVILFRRYIGIYYTLSYKYDTNTLYLTYNIKPLWYTWRVRINYYLYRTFDVHAFHTKSLPGWCSTLVREIYVLLPSSSSSSPPQRHDDERKTLEVRRRRAHIFDISYLLNFGENFVNVKVGCRKLYCVSWPLVVVDENTNEKCRCFDDADC